MSHRDVDRLAAALRRRGLGPPAAILLDAHRPIAPLLADAAVVAGPWLTALGGSSLARSIRHLFEEPDALDALAERLVQRDDASPGDAACSNPED